MLLLEGSKFSFIQSFKNGSNVVSKLFTVMQHIRLNKSQSGPLVNTVQRNFYGGWKFCKNLEMPDRTKFCGTLIGIWLGTFCVVNGAL